MAVRNVLVGRYAECSLGGTVVLLCTDWKVTISSKIIETTAHGDIWERNIAGRPSWVFTAKGYIVPATVNHYPHALYSASTAPAYFVVAGFSGPVTGGTMIFQGSGLPIRGSLEAGMELAIQDWEIHGDGPPTVGVSA